MNIKVNPERRRLLFVLAIASITLVVLATGLSSIDFSAGPLRSAQSDEIVEEPTIESGSQQRENLPGATPSDNTLIAVVAIGVALMLYAAIRWRRARIVIAILLLLTIALLAGANWLYNVRDMVGTGIPLDISPLEDVSGLMQPGEEVAPAELVTDPPDYVNFIITLVILLAAAGISLFLWRHFKPQPKTSRELIALEAENTLSAIRAGMDFRDAISKCYFEMSEALRHDRGLVRRAAMTPREFEALLMKTELPAQHLQRLTRLFEQVRYGGHRVTQRDQMEAVGALEAIVAAVRVKEPAAEPAGATRAHTY